MDFNKVNEANKAGENTPAASNINTCLLYTSIQESYMQFVNEGNNPEQFNPEQAVDIEAFIKEFNENFIDDIRDVYKRQE